MKRTRIAAATLSSLALLTLSACGDDSGDGSEAGAATQRSSITVDTGVTGDSGDSGDSGDAGDAGDGEPGDSGDSGDAKESDAVCTADDVTVTGGFGEKPTITVPDDCTPPSELLSKDLVEGSGDAAREGDTVVTDYLLATWSDGAVVDNSFDRGAPFPVQDVGHAPVIDGWNQGLIGITPGTRRLLVIPSDLGYGPSGSGPIGPDETLVFVVDAVEVQHP